MLLGQRTGMRDLGKVTTRHPDTMSKLQRSWLCSRRSHDKVPEITDDDCRPLPLPTHSTCPPGRYTPLPRDARAARHPTCRWVGRAGHTGAPAASLRPALLVELQAALLAVMPVECRSSSRSSSGDFSVRNEEDTKREVVKSRSRELN